MQINTSNYDSAFVTSTYLHYDEQELIQLLRLGGNKAYTYLYKNYSDALFSAILNFVQDNHTAADILQEVFINIYRKIDSYDASKGKLYTWMLNIARNQSIDILRSKSYRNNKLNYEITTTNISDTFITYQRTDNIGLRKLLSQIKPKYKELIELNYFKGYNNNEIAQMMGIPLSTVKTRMRAALVQLKELM